jgi:hypothetical protein
VNPRITMLAGATVLALLAALMPTAWYDAIPRDPSLALPFSGVGLMRLMFLVEALLLVVLAGRKVRWHRLDAASLSLVPSRREMPFDVSRRWAVAALAAIIVAGVVLRVYGLSQDLWLDEITPILDYTGLSAVQVLGSYMRSNNHLINTLLLKASIAMFGESEWSVRLPAVLFGTLTIPAVYWVARVGLSRIASLGAALMLAGSYHHVFFSQNARGYTAYLLFALLSTGLLVAALRRDEVWRWGLYIAAVVLGSASLLIMSFVLAGHALLCAALGLSMYLRGQHVGPFARRALSVFGVAGLLSVHVYAAALPEAYVVINAVYLEPSTGYPPFSAEFFAEMGRGINAGFGNPSSALVFLLVGAVGFATLSSACWPIAVGLTLPAILTATLLGARGLTFSPRFFLLLLPLAMIAAVSALQAAALVAWKRRLLGPGGVLTVLGVTAALLAVAAGRSLPYYYRTPKQPYRAAIRLAASRYNGGRIVVVSNAGGGVQYYVRRMAGVDASRFIYTRNTLEFDSLTAAVWGGAVQVVTTFSRALQIELPEIGERLRQEWRPDTTFAATIGDGEITVWSRKALLAPGLAR